jgi:hypothetical protein
LTRIQLLANENILEWWNNHANDSQRQDKLRKATEIGLEILQGKKIVVDPEKKKVYDALETLIESGLITPGGTITIPEPPPKEEAPAEPTTKRPDFARLGLARKSSLDATE